MPRTLRWATLTCILAGVACAGHSSPREVGATPWERSSVRLHVSNEFGFPVTVYALSGGTAIRMGRVLPEQMGDFVVANARFENGPIEFVVECEGNAPARSGPLLLTRGQVVDFVVKRPSYASTATVRP